MRFKPSVIKAMKAAGYDLKFVFRYPWFSMWIVPSVIVFPILSGLDMISSEFLVGWYLGSVPMLMFSQKVFFLKLAQRPLKK